MEGVYPIGLLSKVVKYGFATRICGIEQEELLLHPKIFNFICQFSK